MKTWKLTNSRRSIYCIVEQVRTNKITSGCPRQNSAFTCTVACRERENGPSVCNISHDDFNFQDCVCSPRYPPG